MKTAVIIPSYNSRNTIGDCLTSLRNQSTDRQFEVIVVDSSIDDTPDIVNKFAEVKLIKFEQRTPAAVARNIGVQATDADIICLLDADCVASPNWVEQLTNELETGRWAAVGGSVENPLSDDPVACASYISEFSEFVPSGAPRVRNRCVSCNLAVRRDIYIGCGGFDHKFELYDDAEFCQRITSRGGRILFRPDVVVAHQHRKTTLSYARHEARRGRSAVVIRRAGMLPGGALVKLRLAGVLASPFLSTKRFLADMARVKTHRILSLAMLTKSLPHLAVGYCAWIAGFTAESVKLTGTRR